MNSPKFSKKNSRKIILYTDTILPSNSSVILTGHAVGTALYEMLENRFHPLGEYRQDLKYPQFYDYMECLEISPCNGWLSSNETLRNVTDEHAQKLSAVAANIDKERHF